MFSFTTSSLRHVQPLVLFRRGAQSVQGGHIWVEQTSTPSRVCDLSPLSLSTGSSQVPRRSGRVIGVLLGILNAGPPRIKPPGPLMLHCDCERC